MYAKPKNSDIIKATYTCEWQYQTMAHVLAFRKAFSAFHNAQSMPHFTFGSIYNTDMPESSNKYIIRDNS